MKLPKLKYYYYAMTSDAYIDFAVSRTLEVNPTVSIDLLTGAVTGRTVLHLSSSATLADTHFREIHHYTKPVYVLRISRDLIDRGRLRAIADLANTWEYQASLHIPHCGVERIELESTS